MRKSILILFVLICGLVPSAILAAVVDASNVDKSSAYKCRYIEKDFKIGGDFNNPAWKNAEPLEFRTLLKNEVPVSKTEGGVLWSKKYIYVYMKAYDKDIFAYHNKRDSATCEDDVLEFFFKPSLTSDTYYNFETNAQNALLDARTLRRDAAGSYWRWDGWNCKGVKTAVKIKGTINDPSDVDEYWRLELAIPISELNLNGKTSVDAGDLWTFHLGRYDYSMYLPGDGLEFSSTAYFTAESYHHFEDWGKLVFVK